MSDVQQGPGWWQASDGKWYPPQAPAGAVPPPVMYQPAPKIRSAMATHTDPGDQVTALARTVADLGLEPSPPPEPLPGITADDIHLVCWLAIMPATVTTIAEQVGELPLGDKL